LKKQSAINYKKLLRGSYEAERLPQDFSENRAVPDFAFNILNTMGLLYRPVVDENYLSHNGQKPKWPHGKPFATCLTHDVDDVSAFSLKQSLRAIRSPFNGLSKSIHKVMRINRLTKNVIKSALFGFRKDPFHCYERWLEMEREFGARSTFFFWPGWSNVKKHHHTDCTYQLNDRVLFDGQKCNVAEMMREIHHRGWEIGLHPSWHTFNDIDELKRQKEALETALENSIQSVRQHYLHYDIRNTPRAHSEAGFKYDSTLGFNDNIGFRFGTCYPWNLYDLKTEKQLPIVEIPLIIQDVAMLSSKKSMHMDSEMALDYITLLADRVKEVGGVLTLLWHPNEIINPEFEKVYTRSLDYLKRQNCWMTTVKEIGAWWQECSQEL
jgi:peptidoglycan/xylan/chitin deacetylase (PgdA/CDA1 family)